MHPSVRPHHLPNLPTAPPHIGVQETGAPELPGGSAAGGGGAAGSQGLGGLDLDTTELLDFIKDM